MGGSHSARSGAEGLGRIGSGALPVSGGGVVGVGFRAATGLGRLRFAGWWVSVSLTTVELQTVGSKRKRARERATE